MKILLGKILSDPITASVFELIKTVLSKKPFRSAVIPIFTVIFLLSFGHGYSRTTKSLYR